MGWFSEWFRLVIPGHCALPQHPQVLWRPTWLVLPLGLRVRQLPRLFQQLWPVSTRGVAHGKGNQRPFFGGRGCPPNNDLRWVTNLEQASLRVSRNEVTGGSGWNTVVTCCDPVMDQESKDVFKAWRWWTGKDGTAANTEELFIDKRHSKSNSNSDNQMQQRNGSSKDRKQ